MTTRPAELKSESRDAALKTHAKLNLVAKNLEEIQRLGEVKVPRTMLPGVKKMIKEMRKRLGMSAGNLGDPRRKERE